MFSDLKNYDIYLYENFTDMRKSINGLCYLVQSNFKQSLTSESIFIFMGKTKDKLKILYWDKNGYVLYYKRLCKKRYYFKELDSVASLTFKKLEWLLAGLDYTALDTHPNLEYKHSA